MAIRLEYIWVGGNKELRSKVKVEYIENNSKISSGSLEDMPLWNFDGSSTGQAMGEDSEVLLQPIRVYENTTNMDGFEKSFYVLCETLNPNGTSHITNTRQLAMEVFKNQKAIDSESLFGIEHEFFLLDSNTGKPLGFIKNVKGELTPMAPQGPYYCSVGTGNAYGREFLEEALGLAVKTGIRVTGSNLEVCCGQVEIQICNYGIAAADDSLMLKYLLAKLGEKYGYIIDWSAKPVKGDWNGSGCHVNFSTKEMRDEGGYELIMGAIKRLGLSHQEHIEVYGDDNNERLTGLHETSDINTFSSGVANRGCSIRIPRCTEENRRGYFEDRRPSSSADMYLVTGRILSTSIGL